MSLKNWFTRSAMKRSANEALSPSERWAFPRLTDYWDTQIQAVDRGGRALNELSEAEKHEHLRAIREAVIARARALSDEQLCLVAWIMAEDLYKTAATLNQWSSGLVDYLMSTVRPFLAILRDRGFAIEYLVDNMFERTEDGMAGPLVWFPQFYSAAGLQYICPQTMGRPQSGQLDVHDLPRALAELPETELKGRIEATRLVAQARQAKRSFMYLETNAEPEQFVALLITDQRPEIIFSVRTAPPSPGTRSTLIIPAGIKFPGDS